MDLVSLLKTITLLNYNPSKKVNKFFDLTVWLWWVSQNSEWGKGFLLLEIFFSSSKLRRLVLMLN